jgi:predicted Zn-dependent peptidase
LEVLSKDADQGLSLLLDCLLHPTFPIQELERQRAQALASLSQANEEPGIIIEKRFRSLLYGPHPYGHPLAGTRTSLVSIGRAGVEAFYRRFFVPNQAILVAVGDFDLEEMKAKLERLFSSWPKSEVSAVPPPPPGAFQGRKVVLIDKPEVTQANIFVGNIGVPRNTPRFFPLSLANGILGRMGFSSRLMDQIRANLGLSYHIESYFSMGRSGGSFVIETSTRTEKVGPALSAILEQVRIFREQGLSAQELAKVKTYRKGIYYIALQTAGALVAQLADIEFYGLPRDFIDSYQERIDQVSLQDANAAARDLFPYDDLLIVILGNAEGIKDQLRELNLGEIQIEKFQPE